MSALTMSQFSSWECRMEHFWNICICLLASENSWEKKTELICQNWYIDRTAKYTIIVAYQTVLKWSTFKIINGKQIIFNRGSFYSQIFKTAAAFWYRKEKSRVCHMYLIPVFNTNSLISLLAKLTANNSEKQTGNPICICRNM